MKPSCSLAPTGQTSSTFLSEPPLQALARSHQHTRAQCAALLTLAQHMEAHGSNGAAQSTAQALLLYFDTTVHESQTCEEQDLFPALIESMAGSDAVCLRGMTQGLSDMLHTLDQLWCRLRPALIHISEGKAATLSIADTQAFSDGYAAYIERCDEELLPMAERLLTDPEIELLRQAMNKYHNT